jgi:hypothetical protein
MELPLDREDVTAIRTGLFDANRMLGEIEELLESDEGEEEDEDDSDA